MALVQLAVGINLDPQPYGVYGKGVQRGMAGKDAVSCFVISGLRH